VFAVFKHPYNSRWICTAIGADGYWILVDIFDRGWLQGRIIAMTKFL